MYRFVTRAALAAALFGFAVLPVARSADKPKKAYPVIEGYGGVFPGTSDDGPRKGTKVVFDVTGEAKEVGQPVPGLERAALLYNLAGRDSIKPSELHVVIVLHGSAAKYALNDTAFKAEFGKENPNAELIRRLVKAGAKINVCAQSFSRNNFDAKNIATEVKVVAAALTSVINKQTDGYAYIPAP